MKVIINDYHKRANKKQLESVVYWWKCQMSLQKCLNQFKRLREQRLARVSKFMFSV
ncbi:hypothetical protein KSZ12_19125 [Parabacteroides distasonis]|uniref:hypothetical protein n=1 Tax=Parabacteroides distasonis TaxID=823 RepID=UPI001C384D3D|nr:hypothetical protein [Parabacteroides distasonis]MBV4227928.1 hypothetical protein [Parabacteroides distasonis]